MRRCVISFWKTIAGLISNTEARTVRVDASTHSLQTVDYAHHEIHGGSHYFFRSFATLGNGGDVDFGVTIPNSEKWAHMLWEFETTGETLFEVYEGSTYTGGSDPSGTFNSNRNSVNTSGLVIVVDPTVTAEGTLLEAQMVGVATTPSKAIGGGSGRDDEVILLQDTKYIFRFESGSADNHISFRASWYEHTDKD